MMGQVPCNFEYVSRICHCESTGVTCTIYAGSDACCLGMFGGCARLERE